MTFIDVLTSLILLIALLIFALNERRLISDAQKDREFSHDLRRRIEDLEKAQKEA